MVMDKWGNWLTYPVSTTIISYDIFYGISAYQTYNMYLSNILKEFQV